MIDYAKMLTLQHPGCAPILQNFVQPDGKTFLPMPFPLPLPDNPPPKNQTKAANLIRFEIAADVGFLDGVCFMTEVIQQKNAGPGI